MKQQVTLAVGLTNYLQPDTACGVDVFHFDRATGLLSNYRKLPSSQNQGIVLPAFSSSGRYLYAGGLQLFERTPRALNGLRATSTNTTCSSLRP